MQKTVGFIGLGIMGFPQACNILRAGYDVIGFNRSRPAVDRFIAAGGRGAESVAEVARQSDIILTMLPDWPEVQQVALDPDGIADHAKPGTLFVDMSSVFPMKSREIHDRLKARGLRMIDAPVSGGEPKAIDGTLVIMAGGRQEDFDEALPVLRTMASTVTRIGEIGAGNICKLCNQIIVALNIASVSEALTFAAKAGVDPEVVYKAIRGGLAGSTIMDAKAPMMLKGDIKPGGPLRYHIKDLKNTIDAAHEIAMPLPLTSIVRDIMQACRCDGLTNADHGCLVRYYEKISGAMVRKN